jgi:hypothetical protein
MRDSAKPALHFSWGAIIYIYTTYKRANIFFSKATPPILHGQINTTKSVPPNQI